MKLLLIVQESANVTAANLAAQHSHFRCVICGTKPLGFHKFGSKAINPIQEPN